MAILTDTGSSTSGTFTSSSWSNSEKPATISMTSVTGQSATGPETVPETSYLANSTQSKNWASRRLWIKNAAILLTSLAGFGITGSLTVATPCHSSINHKSIYQEWHTLKSRQDNGLTETLDYQGVDLSSASLSENADSFSNAKILTLSQTGTAAALVVSQMRKNGTILARCLEYRSTDEVIEATTTMQKAVTTQGPQYPTSLMAEYRELTKKKSRGNLAIREGRRLIELKTQINAIDKADPLTQQSVEGIKQVRKGLTEIRKSLEKELSVSAKLA